MAVKMDQTTIIVLAVVGSLGVLSAILGFAGAGTYYCDTGLGLGVCAAIFLIIAQVIFAVVGSCCGCCKSRASPSETNRTIGVVCAVASWIATVIAFVLFVVGANASALCDGVYQGIFAGAGVLALAATALGLTSYVLLREQPAATATAAAATSTAATAPNIGGGAQLPVSPAGIPTATPLFPKKPPHPKPKYPKFTLRSQVGHGNVEHVHPELPREDIPQPEYQNNSVIVDLPEGEPQANGGENFDGTAPTLSDLPGVEALASGAEYSDGADFEV